MTNAVENECTIEHRRRFDYWRRSVMACRRNAGNKHWDRQLHASLNNMFQAYRDLVFAKIGVEVGF